MSGLGDRVSFGTFRIERNGDHRDPRGMDLGIGEEKRETEAQNDM